MNKKQLIVVLGLEALIAGGIFVVIFNFRTFLNIIRSQTNLFIPVLQIYIPILSIGILLIYLFRDKKK
jgi:hypothetical protein